ncbi:Lrp/AsnC family transcriptional regulator [Chryseobacterium fluminis]|uniref:Lrp/AsnC family transcriptional regulator n=1 Tax=Chryseobacterium fluminis TaxID=2983606 RepID=UPI002252D2BF|nr:Lrp/AsnC family transcriptional regulator [Chryseobacterium sp. MMS21-Ot14]UZT97957.1 Lrp/AsnC family transcriptional regulator [Chryseobacterium sp. MMS21-Ot14]
MENIDDKDLKLLKLLQNNAKLTVKELAREISLSLSPAFERVKRLENEGYIKKYAAILNAEKLNRGFTVLCQIKLKIHDKSVGNDFVKQILKIDEIVECYNISGDYDFFLKVQAKDMKHYQDFVFNTLGCVDAIGSTHSTFVMAEVKNSHGLNM